MGTLKNWWSFTRKDLHFPAISRNGKYTPFNMEVIWASNQSLLHWGSGSMNEIHYHFCALSKCYFTLARSNSSCPLPCWLRLYFRYKKRDHFSSDTKNLLLVYKMSIDKYVRRSSSEQCCQLWLSRYSKSEKGGNNESFWQLPFSKLWQCFTISIIHSETSQVENTVMEKPIRKSEKFSRKKVTIPVRPLYGRNRANPHFSCPYANWIK